MRASKRQCCCVMCFGVVCFVVGAQLDCVSHAHKVDGVCVCVREVDVTCECSGVCVCARGRGECVGG